MKATLLCFDRTLYLDLGLEVGDIFGHDLLSVATLVTEDIAHVGVSHLLATDTHAADQVTQVVLGQQADGDTLLFLQGHHELLKMHITLECF